MNKRIVVPVFFTLALINTVVSGLWIWDIGRERELLAGEYESAVKLDSSLYDYTSLGMAISKLEEEIFEEKIFNREEGVSLKMTEDVLHLFKENRIKVISYRLEGEENREELAITAEGYIGSVLKLIYVLSFSEEKFRINFIRVDARFPGKPATIVIRITYA